MDAGVEVAERQHLEVIEQLAHPLQAREQRRHHDHRPRALRHAAQEVETRQSARRGEADARALDDRDRDVARRQQQQQRHPGERPGRGAVELRVGEAAAEQEGGHERDRPQVGGGGMGEDEAPRPALGPGPIREVGLEIRAALADEVVAHVDRAPRGVALLGLARALDGSQRHPKLALPGAVGEVLHRLPVAVAAQEVHLAVGAGGVALQHALDQADRLEVLAPVERGQQPQARDHVCHRDLRRRQLLVLAADRLFRGRLLRDEVRVHGGAHGREPRAVLAHALQQLHHERRVDLGRQRRRPPVPGRVDPGHVAVGRLARLASSRRLVRQAAQVLDQGQLQHAGPGPQLADRERGDRLVAVHEAQQLLPVEAAVAVADQLHGHGVDACVARELAGRELGQLAVVAARQVLAHVADLGSDQVVVVEQPLRRRCDELSLVHVLGHREVGRAQHARVVCEAWEHVPRVAARRGVHGEARRQGLGPLLEPLDAQELVPEGLLGSATAAPPAAHLPSQARGGTGAARAAQTRDGSTRHAGRCPAVAAFETLHPGDESRHHSWPALSSSSAGL